MSESRDAAVRDLRRACDELRDHVADDPDAWCATELQATTEQLVATLVRSLLPSAEVAGDGAGLHAVAAEHRPQLARDLLLSADLVLRMSERPDLLEGTET